MPRLTRVLVVAVAVLWTVVPSAQQPAAPARFPNVPALRQRIARDGTVRVIVGVRGPRRLEGLLAQADVAQQRVDIAEAQSRVLDQLVGAVFDVRRFEVVPFFAAQMGQQALDQLVALADVVSIEEDVAELPTLAESAVLVGAPTAWLSGYTGAGWAVAIIDSGVDRAHPFFTGRIVSEACYSNANGGGGQTTLCPGGAFSSTAVGSGDHCPTTYDGCWHGTHVAGIAAGRQYAGGPALNGIGHTASIIAIQAFTGFPAQACGSNPCVQSFVSDQIAALERVYALRNTFRIAAVNMSLGGGLFPDQTSCDQQNGSRKAIIDQLRSQGIATIISSGNSGSVSAISAPACISSAISVGSVDDGSFGTTADEVSFFSNAASFLTMLAPGHSITSSIVNGFGSASGTSMAAPHVTGAWALMRQRKPLASVSEVTTAIRSSGVPINDVAAGFVFPRLNVPAAIGALRVDYMWADQPASNSTLTQPFTMSGWAINMSAPIGSGTGVNTVELRATPSGSSTPIVLGTATYGSARSDIASAFGAQFLNSGWQRSGIALAPGTYSLSAHARNTFNGQYSQLVNIPNVTLRPSARLQIDSPAHNSVPQLPFLISGWAFDAASVSDSGIDTIHLYAYPNSGSGTTPIFLGIAEYGIERSDVGAVFGAQYANSGFRHVVTSLPGGRYNIVAFAHSTVFNAFTVYAENTIAISEPLMNIEWPANGSTLSQPLTVYGWAIDRGAQDNAGIDSVIVWAYPNPGSGEAPIVLGQALHGIARTDVRDVFGSQFLNSGFALSINSLPPSRTYRIAVYVHSAVSGTFSGRTVDVIIP